ncbi:YqaJ viral recombinase family protein [Nonomuraea sp. NPDC049750]|uniref:YqaJ viral recombinase family nuclease n=1 Tax=Nonomuraea sp. NPDC049750 TaxID=3154738 RepID=UPI0033D14F7A
MSAHLILGPDAPREAWLAARLPGITASEIAAVLGISPFESPFSLHWRKRGQLGEQPDNDAMSLGRHLESWIADRYQRDHPDVTLTLAGLYASTDRPWQMITPDRLAYPVSDVVTAEIGCCELHRFGPPVTYGAMAACCDPDDCGPCCPDCPTCVTLNRPEPPAFLWEGKTSATYDGWGDDGTDDIPAYYRAQTLWQADVFDLPYVDLSCLFLHTKKVRHYRIMRDETDLAFMRAEAEAFRERVSLGDPPPIDGHVATTAALKAIHPDVDPDAEVELPAPLARSYRQIKAMKKRMEAREDLIENRVRAHLGRAKTANDPDGKKVASRSVFDQTRVHVETLRALYPEVYAACARKSTTDKLNPGSRK